MELEIKYENGIKVIYTYDKDFYLIKKKIKYVNEDFMKNTMIIL